MSRRRAGFTLIEVLTVIVILGILAAIALGRFTKVRERAMVASVASDLRNLAMQQEVYFDAQQTYAGALTELNPVQLSPGVVVQITYGAAGGWAARGWHESNAEHRCGVFMGDAGAANGAPADAPGVITCD